MRGKKLLSILLALVMVLSMFPVLSASAGWTKNIYVCGVQLKDTNRDDILGDGRFSYNDYEKTLYVKGDVVGYEGDIIVSDSQNLKIQPVGKRTLSCTGYALSVTDNAILTNGGDTGNTLVLNTTGTGPAVGVGAKVTLTLDGANVSALGGKAGFAGPIFGDNEAKLIIKNSTVHASGDEAAIYYFKGGIELTDCSFDINGLRVEGHEVVDAKGDTAKSVDIKPMKTYDIWVCGTQVTEKNQDDVLGDGTCKFQVADSYLFVFKDITYEGAEAAVESRLGKELNLCLKADATIKNTGKGNAVYSNDGLKISGDGKLTAIAAGSDTTALKADGTLTITSGMNVTAEGGAYGIYGKKIEIESATVAAKGGTNAIRASEEGLHLSADIGVVQPVGGQIFGSDIRDKDGAPATEVLLKPVDVYNLKVCGRQVNYANCKDILGDGVFAYNPDTTTLTINGDCEFNGTIIESGITGTTIAVEKDSTLKVIDGHGILVTAPCTIKGPGKLTITGALSDIFVSSTSFGARDANLDLSGKNGIVGSDGTKLYVYDSTISVKASAAAISGFDLVQLNGCYIEAPEDAEIKDGNVKVGDELAKEVRIVPGTPTSVTKYDLWVDNTQVTTKNASDVLGNGVFAFDEASKTLTISGDYSFHHTEGDHGENTGIRSDIDGLTIKVAKDSALSGAYIVFSVSGSTTVTGSGKLTLPLAACSFNVNGLGKPITLTIQNASLVLDSQILGYKDESLVIKNSNILPGEYAASKVQGFKSIELIGCELVKPAGAKIVDGAIKVGDDIAEGIEIKATGAQTNPFVDVKESDYFYDAVLWAYYHTPQVTNGLDKTHFGPYATCTRGQIVTFLWRALGEPAPTITKNPFVDVKESDYYYNAVLWAYENKVTTGTDDTHFAPDAFCKREHAVAFLYRAAGSPEYTNKTNPFEDVSSNAYYYDAVLWAVEKNITKGIDAKHFGPAQSCQRCQIVTFLYRFMNS